jgi:serine protease Do
MYKRSFGWGKTLLAVFFLLLGSFQVTQAQEYSAAQNYALNRPGVVMVQTVFSADVYVNKMKMDERAFYHLLDSIQRADTAGAIFSPEQKLDIVFKEMSDHPTHFFKKTFDYIEQVQQITSSGTGFIITGDGYVATNCHLIKSDNSFIRRKFILTAFEQMTEATISAFEQSWAVTFSEQQRNTLYNTFASVYAKLVPMTLSDLKKNVYVVYRKDSTNNSVTTQRKEASIIIKGDPMPGKDIAILKIESDSSLPVLKIADEKLPEVGEALFVYGYPGPVTNNDFVSTESAIEPTLTSGIVSAIKKSVNGWPLIQMDANINHGSSGGPVCNSKGEVIGLTTFGSIENSGGLAAGLNFAIPVSILYEFMDSVDIEPRLNKPTKLFDKAIDFYNKHYYRKARSNFEEVKKMNPHYPTVQTYIDKCQEHIDNGEDAWTKKMKYFLIGLAIILLPLFFYFYLAKKRTRSS